MTFYIEIGRAADFLVDFRKEAFLEIDDLAALPADQMVVRIRFCFEPVESAAGVYFLCQILVNEDCQVSVDGSQAEAWEFRFQPLVEPCRRRMAFGRAQNCQKPFSLAAVSVVFY